jgi:hypothetical protein
LADRIPTPGAAIWGNVLANRATASPAGDWAGAAGGDHSVGCGGQRQRDLVVWIDVAIALVARGGNHDGSDSSGWANESVVIVNPQHLRVLKTTASLQ